MILNWIPVAGSTRVEAIAYDADSETIYVRFNEGSEWWYGSCPQHVWHEFSSPNSSKPRSTDALGRAGPLTAAVAIWPADG